MGSEVIACQVHRGDNRARPRRVHHPSLPDENPDVRRRSVAVADLSPGIEEDEIPRLERRALDRLPGEHLFGRRPRQRIAEIGVHSADEPRAVEDRRPGAARAIGRAEIGEGVACDLGAGPGRTRERCGARALGLAGCRQARTAGGEGNDERAAEDEDEDPVELDCRSTADLGVVGAEGAERAEVEALLAEWERARGAVVAGIEGFEPRFLAVRLPSGHEPTVLHVLRHLVGGAYTMTRYVLHGLDIPPPPKVGLRATDIVDIPSFVQASAESAAYTHAALAVVRDADLQRPIATRWGQAHTVESLLEHSLVHFLRHRRQLERLQRTVASGERQER